MLKLTLTVATAGLALALPSPIMAQSSAPAPAAAQQRTAGADPNEVICQKQEVIGTRLGSKKVCKTRAEWADAKTQDRHELERVQVQRGSAGQ